MEQHRISLTLLSLIVLLTAAAWGCAPDTLPKPRDGSVPYDARLDVQVTPDGDVDAQVDDHTLDAMVEIPEAVEAVDATRYQTDLEFISQPRPPGSSHWQAVQNLCANRMTELGYTVDLQHYGSGVNVIGTITGTSEPEKVVLLSAHYDHIAGCEGADDNGTGVAALLESARVLSSLTHDRTLVVACWDQEENGMVGSEAYATAASLASTDLVYTYVFEMVGYKSDEPNTQSVPLGFSLLFPDQVAELDANDNRGDFVAFVFDETPTATTAAEGFQTMANAVGLPVLLLPVPASLKSSPVMGQLRRSDHTPFWDLDYPAVMITDTSEYRYPYYHCEGGSDLVEYLDKEFAVKIIQATVGSALTVLQTAMP